MSEYEPAPEGNIETNDLASCGGEFIDAYNRTIRRDDIAGTIDAGIDFRNEKYVVVNDGDNCLRHKER